MIYRVTSYSKKKKKKKQLITWSKRAGNKKTRTPTATSVLQINYLPQLSASANNWSARRWQIAIFCLTSSNNCWIIKKKKKRTIQPWHRFFKKFWLNLSLLPGWRCCLPWTCSCRVDNPSAAWKLNSTRQETICKRRWKKISGNLKKVSNIMQAYNFHRDEGTCQ